MIEYISSPWSSKLSYVINKVTIITKQFYVYIQDTSNSMYIFKIPQDTSNSAP